ncbi:hypothetical protein Q9L42_011610 [Methylomarinum sp. Ch1-1]|uniref:SH3 domain-containing protein n=1 Tax=Methylomarinum roseum TaxID=3067653 RepID=A0AAU7NPX0_9GAMM|nr:hypothetical protein [Methylomarinum sp. Ch1-1]MDP4521059.1 hypothetical protein [Methylomarinum sp. Ch1-1]
MSNGEHENTNESENQTDVETPTEAEQKTEAKGEEKNALNNILASIMEIKESKPKVFYGGIGAVVLVLIIILMSGGSDKELPVHQAKNIVVGQNYVLKSANAALPTAPVRLVSVPGSMAAYDDTEEEDRTGCKQIAPGTPVKVVQTQDAFGKKDAFVQVEMTDGECQGRKGWVLAINIQ